MFCYQGSQNDHFNKGRCIREIYDNWAHLLLAKMFFNAIIPWIHFIYLFCIDKIQNKCQNINNNNNNNNDSENREHSLLQNDCLKTNDNENDNVNENVNENNNICDCLCDQTIFVDTEFASIISYLEIAILVGIAQPMILPITAIAVLSNTAKYYFTIYKLSFVPTLLFLIFPVLCMSVNYMFFWPFFCVFLAIMKTKPTNKKKIKDKKFDQEYPYFAKEFLYIPFILQQIMLALFFTFNNFSSNNALLIGLAMIDICGICFIFVLKIKSRFR